MNRRTAAAVSGTAIAALLVTSCTGDSHQSPSTTSSPTASSSYQPDATPQPTPVNPLTGQGRPPKGTVVVVKIDDSQLGHPQIGVDQADIVYVEETEGGISRLAAVFATNKPTVGYIRSARGQDPELLGAYGPAVLVASGGVSNVLARVDRSPLRRLDMDHHPQWFKRDFARHDYVNVTANLADIDGAFTGGEVRSVGFVWGAELANPASGTATTIRTVVGTTTMAFVWDRSLKRYVRMIGDARYRVASGELVATPNVVVMNCNITQDGNNVDVTGAASMYTHTVGTGKATAFRNGKRIDGTWSRKSATAKLVLTSEGKEIELAPGGAWVLLARNATPVRAS